MSPIMCFTGFVVNAGHRTTSRRYRRWCDHKNGGTCAGLGHTQAVQPLFPLARQAVSADVMATTSDTSGAVVKLADFLLQAGSRDLLSFKELLIMPRDRVGLVGPNGSGKSTLLRAIAGVEGATQGRISVAPNKTVGYLPQQAVSGSELTVWEEAGSQMERLNRAEKDLQAAEAAVTADPSTPNMRWLDTAGESFRAAGGYSRDEKVGGVLTGLGFTSNSWSQKCAELSGGWGMRVALARLLLSEPDVMLLDEPTNHLDVKTKAYLRDFLSRYPYSIVVVSHDKQVLNDVKKIVEVRDGGLDFYTCNYSRFLQLRSDREAQLSKQRERQEVELEKLDSFITRFGAKATKAASAQSKQKALDKLEAKLVRVPTSTKGPKVRLKVPEASPCAVRCVELVDASIGWPAGPVLLEHVSLALERGMRLAIVGKNGVGKSTVMRSLAGLLPLLGGKREVKDDRVSIGVFTQDLAADLPEDKTGVEYLQNLSPGRTVTEIRSALGHLGLTGDAGVRKIGILSGGEKARVALAAFTLCSHNVLMLDEPSNHLDITTVEVLIDALKDYDGAMVLVSHDRRLVEQIATHVLVVEGNRTILHDSVTAEALSLVSDVSSDVLSSRMLVEEGAVVQKTGSEDAATLKQLKREAEKARRKLGSVEKKILGLEEERAALQDRMLEVGDQPQRLAELNDADEALHARLEAMYEEYMHLEEIAGSLEGADKKK